MIMRVEVELGLVYSPSPIVVAFEKEWVCADSAPRAPVQFLEA